MEAYLLDTSALSPLVDDSHGNHNPATTLITGLSGLPIYISTIALAELEYGLELYEKSLGTKLVNADRMLSVAKTYPRLDVDHHTASEYARLKSTIAAHFLPNVTRNFRTKWIEDWVDKFTGKSLGIDDNDLWICAQALQMNFTLIADDKMLRIRRAETKLKWLPIQQ